MRSSIEVQCTGYADIDEFDTEVLEEELARRRKKDKRKASAVDPELELVHENLKAGRADYAQYLLERYLFPKFRSLGDCVSHLNSRGAK
jgi:hypothetical protein